MQPRSLSRHLQLDHALVYAVLRYAVATYAMSLINCFADERARALPASVRNTPLPDIGFDLFPENREVLWLRYTEELSRAEIADVLEIPEPIVKSRIYEGLERLRRAAR